MNTFDLDPKGYLPLFRLLWAKISGREATPTPRHSNVTCCA